MNCVSAKPSSLCHRDEGKCNSTRGIKQGQVCQIFQSLCRASVNTHVSAYMLFAVVVSPRDENGSLVLCYHDQCVHTGHDNITQGYSDSVNQCVRCTELQVCLFGS